MDPICVSLVCQAEPPIVFVQVIGVKVAFLVHCTGKTAALGTFKPCLLVKSARFGDILTCSFCEVLGAAHWGRRITFFRHLDVIAWIYDLISCHFVEVAWLGAGRGGACASWASERRMRDTLECVRRQQAWNDTAVSGPLRLVCRVIEHRQFHLACTLRQAPANATSQEIELTCLRPRGRLTRRRVMDNSMEAVQVDRAVPHAVKCWCAVLFIAAFKEVQ